MENTGIIKNRFQKIIESHFNRISKININNFEYRIAIRKDQIPSIKQIELHNDNLIIILEDIRGLKNKGNLINRNSNGYINCIEINNLKNLKNPTYKRKLMRELLIDINNLPENNKNQILNKHKDRRLAHALSEIINTVPNSGFAIVGDLE